MKKIFLFLLLALALGGCGRQTISVSTAPVSDAPAVNDIDNSVAAAADISVAAPPIIGASQVREFNIIAKQWTFAPAVITVKRGETVKLKVTSVDVEHSFSLPAFGVNLDLAPGQPQTAEFVADQAGEFDFSCRVYCGDGHSTMAGRLVVTE